MNPWLIIFFLLLIAGAVAGGEYDGRQTGAKAERAAWQAKDNAELTAANTKILQLEAAARASEQAHSEVQHLISVSYQKDLQNAEVQRQADVSAARSGALRLRDPGAPTVQACGDTTSQAATAAGGRHGAAGGELSPELAEFLVGEADRADALVRQLSACQAVILADRAP